MAVREVDWEAVSKVLYNQGKTLQGVAEAKTAAGVLLALADAIIAGLRSAQAKAGK